MAAHWWFLRRRVQASFWLRVERVVQEVLGVTCQIHVSVGWRRLTRNDVLEWLEVGAGAPLIGFLLQIAKVKVDEVSICRLAFIFVRHGLLDDSQHIFLGCDLVGLLLYQVWAGVKTQRFSYAL